VFLIATETESSVAAVCRALELPRSTVYNQRNRTPSARTKETATLDVEIAAVFKENKGRYGSPRVQKELKRRGKAVGRKRVAKRMQEMALRARRPKRYRRTTQADASHVPGKNILDRRFDWSQPCQAWVGDITYIWTVAGWTYLAILVDLCTRGIVGWAVSNRCDTVLALRALDGAVARHRPGRGLIHHTDRGSTYTATDYRKRTRALGMVESMSRKGNCWDNAVAESTIGTIKAELLEDWVPASLGELQQRLFPYIEGYFNRQRLHSALGYTTPMEREQERLALSTKAA
jgi:putative transposase